MGFIRCRGLNLPFSSHHSAAIREKRSTSPVSTVTVCAIRTIMNGIVRGYAVTIKVEIATAPDVEILAALHKSSFVDSWNTRAMSELLAVTGTLAFVAGVDSGFSLIRDLGGEAEILTLAVAEQSRRRGVAKSLVSAMRQWARE